MSKQLSAQSISVTLAILISILLPAAPVSAAVLIAAEESNGNVVFSLSGTLDISGISSPDFQATGTIASRVSPGGNLVSFGSPTIPVDVYYWFWSSVGTEPTVVLGSGPSIPATTSSGDIFLIGGGLLLIDQSYLSNETLDGEMTFENATLADLGFSPGPVTATWTLSGSGDTITISIPASVPEPSISLIALLSGMFVLGRRVRYR